MASGKNFMDVEYEGPGRGVEGPVFSESVLYPRLGKGDARFVLGVAEEYEHVINALGPAAVRAILQVKPALVERLGTGKVIVDHLEDARDEMDLWREKQHPMEITVDADAAHEIWQLLFDEYRRYFNPEESMERDSLRLLRKLTDQLGEYEQKALKDEEAKLPEKLKRQEERKKTGKRRTAARNGILKIADGEGGTKAEMQAAVEEWAKANGYMEEE